MAMGRIRFGGRQADGLSGSMSLSPFRVAAKVARHGQTTVICPPLSVHVTGHWNMSLMQLQS